MGNAAGGLAHGMLSLIGMGGAYNPMGDLSSELNSAVSDMNNMVADNTVNAFLAQQKEFQAMYQDLRSESDRVVAAQEVTNTQLYDSLQIENTFITILTLTIIIIVFYLLVQKKCC